MGHTGAVSRRLRLDWVFGRLWSSKGRPGHRSCPRLAGASPGPSRWRCPEAARTCVASGDALYAGLCGSEQGDEIKPREMIFEAGLL